jgi:predicted ATPase
LGGLVLEPRTLTQPKPLLLLAYLALEGPQPRRRLAELFWPEGQRMKSLSMTLTRLLSMAGEVVDADARRAWASVRSDAAEVLAAVDRRDWRGADELYAGVFLDGVAVDGLSVELEEWIYATREYLVERVQYAMLSLAESAVLIRDFDGAARHAERAYRLAGPGGTEPGRLGRIHVLLAAGTSPVADDVRREAADFGLVLEATTREAVASLDREAAIPNNLRLRGNVFIGRDPELTEIATMLADPTRRLLTLVGPGGVGKTRLALQVAHEQLTLGAFRGGVHMVSFEAFTPGEQPSGYLAQALTPGARWDEDPLRHVAGEIGTRRALLVLDNVDELGPSASEVAHLLAACPNLEILATSRERLNLEGEQVIPLESLGYPEAPSPSWDEARTSDAVRLFVARAQQVHPQFELTPDNLPGVARLCRLLEGSPLGVELAARWMRSMSADAIAEELERNLDFLASGLHDVPERQRSLRAVFESSWRLLDADEQEVLCRLSVFRGGFERHAAAQVAGATIPVLGSLVEKSLLRVLPDGRFERHPLLYQYMQEKLAADEAAMRATQRRHAAFFLAVLDAQREAVRAGRQDDAVRILRREWDNVGVVLESAMAEERLEVLDRFVGLMRETFEFRGALQEGLALLRRVAARLAAVGSDAATAPSPTQSGLGPVQIEEAWYLYRLGAFAEARDAAERGLASLPSAGAQAWAARALNTLGLVERATGAPSRALGYFERAAACAHESGDSDAVATVLGSLAIAAGEEGDLARAEALFLEAIAAHRQSGRILGLIRELGNLAITYAGRGSLDEARRLQEEAVRLAREIGFRQTLPYTLSNLAETLVARGELDEARALNLEALGVAEATGQREIQVGVLNGLVGCAMAAGDVAQGLSYSAQAMRLAHAIGTVPMMLQALLHRAELYVEMGAADDAATLLAVVSEHPSTVDFERRRARSLLDDLGVPARAASRGEATVGRPALEDEELRQLVARAMIG